MRKVRKKRAIENELGKSMSETNGDRNYVSRQAMYTGRPKLYQCYTLVWVPKEDESYVAETRISKWTH